MSCAFPQCSCNCENNGNHKCVKDVANKSLVLSSNHINYLASLLAGFLNSGRLEVDSPESIELQHLFAYLCFARDR
jgi:hypothetical protein